PVFVLFRRLVADPGQIGPDAAPASIDHVAGAASLFACELLGEVDLAGASGLAIVAVARVAAHLHKRAFVVGGERVVLAEPSRKQRFFPVLASAVGFPRVDRVRLTTVADGAAVLLDRMLLEHLGRVRSQRLLGVLEACPADRLVAGDAAVGAPELGQPDLLKAGRNSGRLVGAVLAGDAILELMLPVAPIVAALAPEEESGRDDEDHAHDRQQRLVTTRNG